MFTQTVQPGRYTAELDGDGVIVFLIGMRFNQWWRVDKWWFIYRGMATMLKYLRTADEGLLKSGVWVGRTMIWVQYWRSMDELLAFATNSTAPHAKAWQKFNKRVGNDGSIGIYHETYQVHAGDSEAMYVNMPLFGLGAALDHVKVDETREYARQRMARQRAARKDESPS
jgi:hypothetical protein